MKIFQVLSVVYGALILVLRESRAMEENPELHSQPECSQTTEMEHPRKSNKKSYNVSANNDITEKLNNLDLLTKPQQISEKTSSSHLKEDTSSSITNTEFCTDLTAKKYRTKPIPTTCTHVNSPSSSSAGTLKPLFSQQSQQKPLKQMGLLLDKPTESDNEVSSTDTLPEEPPIDSTSRLTREEIQKISSPHKKRELLKKNTHTFMYMKLKEFPVIDNKDQVEILILYDCSFTEIPESIYEYSNLHCITISSSKLSKLPENIYKMKNLTVLHIKNCIDLKILPSGLFECPSLIDLEITGCSIEYLPSNIGLSPMLKLNLSNNKIVNLPDTLVTMSSLKSLNLSHNYIQVLPTDIGDLKSLEELNMSHNQIKVVKEDNRKYSLQFRKELKTYQNYTTATVNCPEDPVPLPSLVRADFSYNLLEYIPTIFFASQYIISLDFSSNNIKTVDRSVDRLLRRAGFKRLSLRLNYSLEEFGDMQDDCGFREIFWLFNNRVELSNNILEKVSQPIPKEEAYQILSLCETNGLKWNYKKIRKLKYISEDVLQDHIADLDKFSKSVLNYKLNEYLLTLKNNVVAALFTFPPHVNNLNTEGLGEYWTYIMRDELGPGNSRLWANVAPKYPYSNNVEDPFFNSLGNAILAFYTRFTIETAVKYIRNKINSEHLLVKNVIRYVHLKCSAHRYNDLFTYKNETKQYAEVSRKCILLLLDHFEYIENLK